MKNFTLLYCVLFISINCIGQTPDYKTSLDNAITKYNIKTKVIQDTLLNENIANAFNYVIFSSSDLVSNASAFGYSQNEEKTNVTISTNLRLGKELSPIYAKIGANATGSKNIFNFYSDDSWSNNVSFNIGLILKVGKSSVFFKGDKEKFDKINSKRTINASEPLYQKDKYTNEILTKIQNLKKDILSLRNIDNLVNTYSELFKELPEIKKLIEGKKFEEAFSQLDSEEDKIDKYLKALKSKDKLDRHIENVILYNFDKANDITYGYSLKWFDINLSLGNSTYKFSESNIDESVLEDFSNTFDLTKDLNKLKSVLSINFNHSHNAKETIWYYQLGLSTTSSSFLENTLINGTPKIVQNQNLEYIFQDEGKQVLGTFNNVKENFKTGSFNAYGAIFFTKKKNFGFNLAVSHNYLIDKPDGTFYHNNFTALFGPIFRKEKDDQTSLTFGIDLGWENAIYNTKISNDFTGRIRIGIPFNIYSKKKTE